MLASTRFEHMLLGKTFLFLALIHLYLLCNLAGAEPIALFNEAEAQKLNYPENEWLLAVMLHQKDLDAARDIQAYSDGTSSLEENIPGPIVHIIDPESEGDIYKSSIPLRLLIYLKSRLAPINIETLTVKGKRGIFTLNITDRIKTFLRQPEGDENADYVIDAKIPKLGTGHYLITLSLADIDGNQEEQKAFLEVR